MTFTADSKCPRNGHPGGFRNSFAVSAPFIQTCFKCATIFEHPDKYVLLKKGPEDSLCSHTGGRSCKATTNVPTINYL